MSRSLSAFRRGLTVSGDKLSKAMNSIEGLRINYQPKEVVSEDNLPSKDPIKLFENWFNEARQCEKIEEVNAMTLATATKDGRPSARVVLLKGFDETGFKFYTNYNSRKGKEIAENKNVALVVYWQALHKSIRIEGEAEKLMPGESDNYFHSRPHDSQIGACVSNQSQPIPSKQVLMDKFSELKQTYPTDDSLVQRPDNWGGYLVRPRTIEFWQGQANRLHNRFEFVRGEGQELNSPYLRHGDNGWLYQLLSP